MEKQIFDWEELLEAEPELLGFGGCTFKKDFGPWKQGYKAESIWIHIGDSRIEEQSNDGNKIAECMFTLVPLT